MKKLLHKCIGISLGIAMLSTFSSCIGDSKANSSEEKNKSLGNVYITTFDQEKLLAESEKKHCY